MSRLVPPPLLAASARAVYGWAHPGHAAALPCGAVRSRVAGRPMSVVLSVQPGEQAGDIIFVIDQSPHAVFTRHGDSLSITKRIKLVEALCGPNMQCNNATMLRRSATASPAHVHAY
jgi:hypothetical protein